MTARVKKKTAKKETAKSSDEPISESYDEQGKLVATSDNERLPGIYLDDLERKRRQDLEDDYHARAKDADKDEDDKK